MDSNAIGGFFLEHGAMLASVGGSIVAGSIAVSKYLQELRKTREQQLQALKQKDNELRWEQARAGKGLNDEMLDDAEARAALTMLDMEPEGQTIRVDGTRVFEADYATVLRAITFRVPQPGQSRLELAAPGSAGQQSDLVEIRTCFDALFYYLAIIEHYLSSGLLHFDDVAYPLNYYVRQLAHERWWLQFRTYIEYYQLGRARKFLQRFESWRLRDSDLHAQAEDVLIPVRRVRPASPTAPPAPLPG